MKSVRDLLQTKKQTTVSCAPDSTVLQALKMLSEGNYGALPVVDAGKLVGVVSERDYTRKVILKGKASDSTKVADIMTWTPITVSLDDSTQDCMTLMTTHGIRHLPVVDDGVLSGFLSMKDVMRELLEEKEHMVDHAVMAGSQRYQDMESTRDMILKTVATTSEVHMTSLAKVFAKLDDLPGGQSLDDLVAIAKSDVNRVNAALAPLRQLFHAGQGMKTKRVLLGEREWSSQIVARMALGGTGVMLDIASNLAEGTEYLRAHQYDVLFLSTEMLELADIALRTNPKASTVFLTSQDAPVYLPLLRQFPSVSNIVSRSAQEKFFTSRTLMTTISKIINQDFFGLEKYLSWGIDVKSHDIKDSGELEHLTTGMAAHLEALGVHQSLVGRCVTVAEELLMNAIYDAPVGPDGRPKYNHLSRMMPVHLLEQERGRFRYACDGTLIAISVDDPFGAYERTTILDYLERCYAGVIAEKIPGKGGGGFGTFMVMESSDLVVYNVKEKQKTEVIALFAVDPTMAKQMKTSSFHYFNA